MTTKEKDFINSVDLGKYNIIPIDTLCRLFDVKSTAFNCIQLTKDLKAEFVSSKFAYFKKPTVLKLNKGVGSEKRYC